MTVSYRALLVGNGIFDEDPHNLPALRGPPNDLRAMEEALTHPDVGLHEPDNVTVLLDRSRNEILETLEEFLCGSNRDDQLLFYYSGHGELDKRRNLYLCAADTRTNSLVSTGIPDAAINNMIANSVSRRIILILDCCNSGRFKAGAAQIPDALAGAGRFILASSRAVELSKDAATDVALSPFTHFLVRALHAYDADTNVDGFLSVSEVYEYVLPRLTDQYKQLPMRNFDNAEGSLAIGRAAGGSGRVVEHLAQPKLAVSTESIKIDDVAPDERLPDEIIDVFNEGGGQLTWNAHCDDPWIELDREDHFVRLRLKPQPGTNRGRLYIRAGAAGSKRIAIRVNVRQHSDPPHLTLSQSQIDFGEVHAGASRVSETVRLINTGDGDLSATVQSEHPQLSADLIADDVLEIGLRTDQPGKIDGQVIVQSAGGSTTIPVRAKIVQGPVLRVRPKVVDYGTLTMGRNGIKPIKMEVRVQNTGGGTLEWDFQYEDSFYHVERSSTGLVVTLHAEVGKYLGSIRISSNGGKQTVEVRAKVKPATRAPSSAPKSSSIAGRWGVQGVGSFTFQGGPKRFSYLEHNFLGIQVGQGEATQDGTRVVLQGFNIEGGPIRGEFVVQGANMTGTLQGLLGQQGVQLVRF